MGCGCVGVWGVGGVGACRAKPCLGLIPFPISHCFQPIHRLSTAAATAAAGISRMAVQPLSPRSIANMACAQWPPGEQRKSGWPPGTGALPHTLGPASATGPGPDQGRVCQEVLSCHWPAPQSGQPEQQLQQNHATTGEEGNSDTGQWRWGSSSMGHCWVLLGLSQKVRGRGGGGAETWWDLYWTEDDDIAEVSIGR